MNEMQKLMKKTAQYFANKIKKIFDMIYIQAKIIFPMIISKTAARFLITSNETFSTQTQST